MERQRLVGDALHELICPIQIRLYSLVSPTEGQLRDRPYFLHLGHSFPKTESHHEEVVDGDTSISHAIHGAI